MKYEYFIASRWRNRDIVFELRDKLKSKGKIVYCFMDTDLYHSPESDPEQTMQEYENTENWRETQMVKDIFKKDMDALKDSQTVILLLPAGKSSHIESGVAYGLGKKLILVGEQKTAESLYLIFNESYNTINEFIESI